MLQDIAGFGGEATLVVERREGSTEFISFPVEPLVGEEVGVGVGGGRSGGGFFSEETGDFVGREDGRGERGASEIREDGGGGRRRGTLDEGDLQRSLVLEGNDQTLEGVVIRSVRDELEGEHLRGNNIIYKIELVLRAKVVIKSQIRTLDGNVESLRQNLTKRKKILECC
jgi:hypothetical protein